MNGSLKNHNRTQLKPSSAGQIKTIRKWICWGDHSSTHCIHCNSGHSRPRAAFISPSLFSLSFPNARKTNTDTVTVVQAPHTTTSWRGSTFAPALQEGGGTHLSLCVSAAHKRAQSLFVVGFFCEHFTALLGAGLRLPVVFLWPLNNYQLVEAGSWIPETKFILLVGGKGLCLSLQPSVQQTRQLLPQIAQTVFGSLSCMPKATPPGFTWWRRLHELLLKNREKYFQR